MSTEAAARGRSNRRRGHQCERDIVAWLKTNGFPDASTTRAKLGTDGTRTPGDIAFHPYVVMEAKDVKASAWPSWQRQALAECGEHQAPIVVRRLRGVSDPGRWTVRVHARSWLEVVRGEDASDVGADEWWPMSLAMAAADVRGMDS